MCRENNQKEAQVARRHRIEHDRRRDHKIHKIKAVTHCLICGESNPLVLSFHHRDPAQKEGQLVNLGRKSWQLVIDELPKCDVICENCHRIVHARETFLDLEAANYDYVVPKERRIEQQAAMMAAAIEIRDTPAAPLGRPRKGKELPRVVDTLIPYLVLPAYYPPK